MSKKMLFLRTCDKDMRAHGGFQWPLSGPVDCPDWVDNHECGHGLHGLLNGAGHGSYLDLSIDAMWVVFEADHANGIPEQNPDKYKVPVAHVVCVGDRKTATDYLIARGCDASKVVGAYITGGYGSTLTGGDVSTLTGGDDSTLTGGYRSTLTGGDGSTLTGGDGSTLTGGDDSTLTGGDRSTLTGGDDSTLTGGDRSTLTGGYGSTLTGGYGSTLTGGYDSTLTGGYGSTLTGGDVSTLTGGYRSILTGGDGSTLTWKVWDGKYYRLHTVYTGEDGIKPDTPYQFVNGEFQMQGESHA